jgi:hypothetical protein
MGKDVDHIDFIHQHSMNSIVGNDGGDDKGILMWGCYSLSII